MSTRVVTSGLIACGLFLGVAAVGLATDSEPAKPSEVEKPSEPAKPSEAPEGNNTGKPTTADEPSAAGEPAQAIKPSETAELNTPSEEGKGSETVEPSNPTAPSDSTEQKNALLRLAMEYLEITSFRDSLLNPPMFPAGRGSSEEQEQRMKMERDLRAKMDIKSVEEAAVASLSELFTLEELTEINTFLRTPTGRAYREKLLF